MKAVLSFSAVALFVSGALGQLTINTPASLVQCEPVLLSWTGGQSPYFLSIFPDGQPGTTLENLGQQSGTSFTWDVNIASGQSVGFQIRDSTGALGQTAAVVIQSSSDSSCVGQSASGSGGSAAPTTSGAASSGAASSAASTTAAGSTTGSATSHAASGTSTTPASASASSHSSSASGSASASTASASNAASTQAVQMGAAGVLGAAVLALLA